MISVSIPAYNEGKYIGKCLESLMKQNQKLEVVVVDSYSKDDTVKIAEDYGAKVLFTPFGNAGKARDIGIRAGKGNIIASCSADAVYPRGWSEKIIEPLISKKADAVIGPIFIYEATFIESVGGHLLNNILFPATAMLNMTYANADNIAIGRKFYNRIGGFPHVATGEDTMLIKNAKLHGKVMYHKDAVILTNSRRIRRWGYAKYLLFHTRNFIDANIFSKTHDKYEPIR
ncbi:MAG: glycosyltransferase family A protein [Candidatus Micrarchaeota archaeon]|nr:glycosyltransferase family A protein [Candidatus Micrarchaeota archaeon]